jgi:uncharacterized cupin superfamily protein
MTTTTTVFQSRVDADSYEPFLYEGEQAGEVHWLRDQPGAGNLLYAGLWRTGPLTLNYVFGGDETFQVLEGSVSIELEDGKTVDLSEGDIASFTVGTRSIWRVDKSFKKFFVISG